MKMMPAMVMPKKTISSSFFINLASINPEGIDRVVEAVMKARAVPIGTPLFIRASTTGMTPIELVYKGVPINTAAGTVHQALLDK